MKYEYIIRKKENSKIHIFMFTYKRWRVYVFAAGEYAFFQFFHECFFLSHEYTPLFLVFAVFFLNFISTSEDATHSSGIETEHIKIKKKSTCKKNLEEN